MDNLMTREEAFQWIEDNRRLIDTSQKFDPQTLQTFFLAYNLITGEKKGLTSCGNCILNMKRRLQAELKNYSLNMKKYPVYKTQKGTLTFKENSNLVMWIHASSDSLAKAQLEQIKKQLKENGVQ